ncbi:MAG: IS1595 family transposase [Alphaproteobacteria bacterium]|nr:IS1595 family transposase [Alphaproteobacteria bacterium]
MSILNAPHFHDEEAAYKWVEARVWPDGRVCPHCGVVDQSAPLKGKSTRIGTYKCYACRKPFTVKVGTIFEASHVKLHIWLQAIFLIVSSKKGISANQLHRTLGVTLKTAWFMGHRIREAMDNNTGPLGGEGKIVEADETFIGKPDSVFINGKGWVEMRGVATKRKVISLVERGGQVRSIKVDDLTGETIRKVLSENVAKESRLHTDEAQHYKRPGKAFAKHERVNHSEEEYARGDVTTNTVEGFFGIFKRGMRGIYQHCGEQHLQRYLYEFDFRYNNRIALGVDDATRADNVLKGVVGKRLTYQTTR